VWVREHGTEFPANLEFASIYTKINWTLKGENPIFYIFINEAAEATVPPNVVESTEEYYEKNKDKMEALLKAQPQIRREQQRRREQERKRRREENQRRSEQENRHVQKRGKHGREWALRILGVSRDASSSEIRKQYIALARKYHPDKPGGSDKKMKDLNEAASILEMDGKAYENIKLRF
jgi:uncharacterized protein with von Willebrand factor type A (vWA) domain